MKEVRSKLLQNKLNQNHRYDINVNPINYHPDDFKFVKNNMSTKLDPVYSGTYEVISDDSPNVKI